MANAQGRYLFLKGRFDVQLVTLVYVYIPNTSQLTFLELCLSVLPNFAAGKMILHRDFNVALDLLMNSFRGSSNFSYP